MKINRPRGEKSDAAQEDVDAKQVARPGSIEPEKACLPSLREYSAEPKLFR